MIRYTLALLLTCASVADALALKPTRTVGVPLRDGTTLATDVYFPGDRQDGRFPVVFVRTPYGKGSFGPENARDTYLTHGVVVVVQDTRMQSLFATDRDDGHDSLVWIVKQPWCNGHIAMEGVSAGGIVQYLLAPGAPKQLCALSVSAATPNLPEQAIFPGGVYRERLTDSWLMVGKMLEPGKALLAANPDPTAGFWDTVRITDRFPDVDVPAVHRGGWFDIFSQGTIDAYVGFRKKGKPRSRDAQYLIMGPWEHTRGRGIELAALFRHDTSKFAWEYGGDRPFKIHTDPRTFAFRDSDAAPLWVGSEAWILHQLGVKPLGERLAKMPRVQYYVMGDVYDPKAPGNEWRAAKDWPPPAVQTRLHLHANGELTPTSPNVPGRSFTRYLYDPLSPCPTRGGRNLFIPQPGPQDQSRDVESRPDVVKFETPALAQPLEITGRVRATIYVCSANVPDTDIMVRLCDVYPDGKSILLLDGATRITFKRKGYIPGTVVPVEVDLWSTSVILNQGHRLRLSVSSSNCPQYRANPNDGSLFGPGKPKVADVEVHHSPDYPSFVELPLPKGVAVNQFHPEARSVSQKK